MTVSVAIIPSARCPGREHESVYLPGARINVLVAMSSGESRLECQSLFELPVRLDDEVVIVHTEVDDLNRHAAAVDAEARQGQRVLLFDDLDPCRRR